MDFVNNIQEASETHQSDNKNYRKLTTQILETKFGEYTEEELLDNFKIHRKNLGTDDMLNFKIFMLLKFRNTTRKETKQIMIEDYRRIYSLKKPLVYNKKYLNLIYDFMEAYSVVNPKCIQFNEKWNIKDDNKLYFFIKDLSQYDGHFGGSIYEDKDNWSHGDIQEVFNQQNLKPFAPLLFKYKDAQECFEPIFDHFQQSYQRKNFDKFKRTFNQFVIDWQEDFPILLKAQKELNKLSDEQLLEDGNEQFGFLVKDSLDWTTFGNDNLDRDVYDYEENTERDERPNFKQWRLTIIMAEDDEDDDDKLKTYSTFIVFRNSILPNIKKNYPDLSFGEQGKIIDELYKKLTPTKKSYFEGVAHYLNSM